MVYGVIGALMREFGPSATGWVVTSFLLVGAIAAALGSRLGDIFGRKRVVMVMLVLAMTGSVINATSDDVRRPGRGPQHPGRRGRAAAALHRPRARILPRTPGAEGHRLARRDREFQRHDGHRGRRVHGRHRRLAHDVLARRRTCARLTVLRVRVPARLPGLRVGGRLSTGWAVSSSPRRSPRCCSRWNSGKRQASAIHGSLHSPRRARRCSPRGSCVN